MTFRIQLPRFRAWANLTSLFALSWIAASSAEAEECQLKRMASLDMADSSGGSVLVPLTINGSPKMFLVDTAGIYSSITESTINEMHLQTAKAAVTVYSASGKKMDRATDIQSLLIGNNEAKHIHLLVTPDFDNKTIAGTLAPDLLKLFDVELDFAAKKLNLFSPAHCEGKVVYWAREYTDVAFRMTSGDHIAFQMSLDGHDLTTALDTGSSVTTLLEPAAYRLYNLDEKSANVDKSGDLGIALYRYQFNSLALSGIAVNHPLIYVVPDLAERAFRNQHTSKMDSDPLYGVSLDKQQLILGTNVLRKLHLYIAYKEHKIYVTAADAHL
ncbi:MAG TPA: aspartyl protease family protein [Rhizomicrobium sp.]|jgi:predicted aspartyl protease|nr:aspartyl protease family protein [Rhizomicrobium sp.]